MTSLSTDLLTLLELQRALSFAAEEEEGQWKTIGGHPGPGGEHVGGTPVKMGSGGEIEAGPKSLEGKNVNDLSTHPQHPLHDRRTGRAFSSGKSKVKAKDVKAAEAAYANALTQYGPNNQATIRAEMKYRELKDAASGKKESNVTPHPPQPEQAAGNAAPAGEAVAEREPGAESGEKHADEGHSGTAQADVGGNEPTAKGNSDVDVSRQFGLFAKDKAGAPVEVGERAGQANLFNPSKYKTAEKPKEEPVKPQFDPKHTAEMFPQGSGENVLKQMTRQGPKSWGDANYPDPIAQEILRSPEGKKIAAQIPPGSKPIGAGAASVVLQTPEGDVMRIGPKADRPNLPEVLQPTGRQDFGGYMVERLPKADTSGITDQDVAEIEKKLNAQGYTMSDPGTDNLGRLPDGRVVVIDAGAVSKMEGNNAPNTGTEVGSVRNGDASNPDEQPDAEGVAGGPNRVGNDIPAPSAPPVQPQPPVSGEGAEEGQDAGKVEPSAERYRQAHREIRDIEKQMSKVVDIGARRKLDDQRMRLMDELEHHKPAALAEAQREIDAEKQKKAEADAKANRRYGVESGYDKPNELRSKPTEGGISGVPLPASSGENSPSPAGEVGEPKQPERTEQDIAQAVNRGEMSVEDVLETHPHLAGDALVEQHRREQREAAEAAEAEREAEEQGMGDEGTGEVPDFMEGLEEPQEAAHEPQATEPEPTPAPTPAKPPKPAKTGKKQRPKGMLEQTLLDNYERENADQEMADDEALADFHHPFTFKRDPKTKSGFPGEVERFLEGAPKGVKRLFELTDSATGGQGADAMGKLGEDRYFELAGRRGGMTGKLRAAIEAGKKSNDPQVQWAASYYDLEEGEKRGKTEKHDPKDWMTGTTATVKGIPVEVVKDAEGHRSLKDGGELPELPLDAVGGKLPFDKGSVKPGKPSFQESGKWSPSKTNSAEKMAEGLVNDPTAAQRMTEKKPEKAIAPEAMGDVFPDVEMPAAEEPSTTPGADPVTTGETEPKTPVESSEPPISEEKRPSTPETGSSSPPPSPAAKSPEPPAEPQSPETVAKDLGDVLLALGTDRRTVDKLVTETMNSDWSGSVDDAIRFAMARYRGERPVGEPKVKKADPTPQETPNPAPGAKEPKTVYNPKTDLYEPVEESTPQGLPRMQMRPPSLEQQAAQKLAGPPKGVKPPPTAQQLRKSAQLPQPPSKLPAQPHQAPPTMIKKSRQATSALAAANPVKVGKAPHAAAPRLPHLPTGRAPATPRLPSVASQIHRSRFGTHAPRTAIRNTIGQQPGQTRPVKVHAGRGMSQSEIDRAKGRELKELFSAEADESLARTLSLLEMLT